MPIYRIGNTGSKNKLSRVYRIGNNGVLNNLSRIYRIGNSGQKNVIHSSGGPAETTAATLRNQNNSSTDFYGGDTITLTRGAYTTTTSTTQYRLTIYRGLDQALPINDTNWEPVVRATYTGSNSSASTNITYNITDQMAYEEYYFIGEVRVTIGSTNYSFLTPFKVLSRVSFSVSGLTSTAVTQDDATLSWTVGGISNTDFIYSQRLVIRQTNAFGTIVQDVSPIFTSRQYTFNNVFQSGTTYHATIEVIADDGWRNTANPTKLTDVTFFTTLLPAPINTVAPVIGYLKNLEYLKTNRTPPFGYSGYLPVSTILTASQGTWLNTNAFTTYKYDWYKEDSITGLLSYNFNAGNALSYSTSDVGDYIFVGVEATNSDGAWSAGQSGSYILGQKIAVGAITPTSANLNTSTNFSFAISHYPSSYIVDWGDGTSDSYTVAADTSTVNATHAHTYTSSGSRTITVTAQPGDIVSTANITVAASPVNTSLPTITTNSSEGSSVFSSNSTITINNGTWTGASSYSYELLYGTSTPISTTSTATKTLYSGNKYDITITDAIDPSYYFRGKVTAWSGANQTGLSTTAFSATSSRSIIIPSTTIVVGTATQNGFTISGTASPTSYTLLQEIQIWNSAQTSQVATITTGWTGIDSQTGAWSYTWNGGSQGTTYYAKAKLRSLDSDQTSRTTAFSSSITTLSPPSNTSVPTLTTNTSNFSSGSVITVNTGTWTGAVSYKYELIASTITPITVTTGNKTLNASNQYTITNGDATNPSYYFRGKVTAYSGANQTGLSTEAFTVTSARSTITPSTTINVSTATSKGFTISGTAAPIDSSISTRYVNINEIQIWNSAQTSQLFTITTSLPTVSTSDGSWSYVWDGGSASTAYRARVITKSTDSNGTTATSAYSASITTSAALSAPSGGVAGSPTLTTQPITAGRVGAIYSASVTTEATGNPSPTKSYQWQYFRSSNSTWTNISGATSSTYTIPYEATSSTEGTISMPGRDIAVLITWTNSQGSQSSRSSSVSISLPTITGITATLSLSSPFIVYRCYGYNFQSIESKNSYGTTSPPGTTDTNWTYSQAGNSLIPITRQSGNGGDLFYYQLTVTPYSKVGTGSFPTSPYSAGVTRTTNIIRNNSTNRTNSPVNVYGTGSS